jgi:histone-lysine N-methyltransferase SETD3
VHAAYAAVLPKFQSTGCVLEWTAEEVDWLRGSELYTRALDIRTAAETSWKELEPIVQRAERDGLIKKDILSKERVKHAFALLLSRLIRLNFSGVNDTMDRNEVEVLCPLADFVNHDSTCSSFLQLDNKNENITLTADRVYRPGEQIYASYGQKTSGELLLSYGFVPEEGSNPHDACLLSIKARGTEEKKGKNGFKVFPLRMGAVPQSLLEALCSAAEEENVQGEQLLVDVCKQKLEKYSINLEDAKAELLSIGGSASGGGGSSGQKEKPTKTSIKVARREAVLRILVQEQKILARTIFLMKQQLKQTTAQKR